MSNQMKDPTAPKGRPTPSRKQAEKSQKAPIPPPPLTRAEARQRRKELHPYSKAEKQAQAQERKAKNTENRARMLAGEENFLLAKDRGPIKRYAREVIDSRRSISNYMMPTIFVVLFISIFMQANPALVAYASPITLGLLMIFVLDAAIAAMITIRKIRTKFPKETISVISIGFYAFARSTQLPNMRVPRPDPNIKR